LACNYSEAVELKEELERYGLTYVDKKTKEEKTKSIINYYAIKCDLKKQKLDGIPYKDVLTFAQWKDKGYKIKKGAKSSLLGIRWGAMEKEVEKKDKKTGTTKKEMKTILFPNFYYLFHKEQVELI
jgi:hypothetical protein